MVFRTHVEKRALVALVERVQECSEGGSPPPGYPRLPGELWERRLTVYLVDTVDEKDVWVHQTMKNVADSELSPSDTTSPCS